MSRVCPESSDSRVLPKLLHANASPHRLTNAGFDNPRGRVVCINLIVHYVWVLVGSWAVVSYVTKSLSKRCARSRQYRCGFCRHTVHVSSSEAALNQTDCYKGPVAQCLLLNPHICVRSSSRWYVHRFRRGTSDLHESALSISRVIPGHLIPWKNQ